MNPAGWFEIYVEDMERAKKFYEIVFKVKLEEILIPTSLDGYEKMWTFNGDRKNYGANGALVKKKGVKINNSSLMIYFSCHDCSVEESRVEKAGGSIEKSKFSIDKYGFISLIHDSEGNRLGLHSLN